jgi:hypothetical protein
LKYLIPFTFFIILICSCKKENDPNPDPIVAAKRNYLTKVVDYSGSDTTIAPVYTENYYYDTLNRLISIATYQPGVAIIMMSTHDSTVYSYNGTDTLPFQSTTYDPMFGTSIDNFVYDNIGRIISEAGSITYSYSSNQIVIIGDDNDTLTYDGHNVTQDITDDDPTVPAARGVQDIQFSTLRNPYNLVNINRHIPYIIYFGYDGFLLNENAISEVDGTITFQYDYVVDGLPGKAIILGVGKEYYFYKE